MTWQHIEEQKYNRRRKQRRQILSHMTDLGIKMKIAKDKPLDVMIHDLCVYVLDLEERIEQLEKKKG